jgi:hypothetical protein
VYVIKSSGVTNAGQRRDASPRHDLMQGGKVNSQKLHTGKLSRRGMLKESTALLVGGFVGETVGALAAT